MAHARQQIRDYVYGVLLAGGTTAGSNVFDSRVFPYDAAVLPALAVYAVNDRTLSGEGRGPTQGGKVERELRLRVEGRAKGTGWEDTLDTLDEEVQALLLADTTLGARVKDITHDETDIDLSGDQEKAVGKADMDYLVRYYINQANPGTLLAS